MARGLPRWLAWITRGGGRGPEQPRGEGSEQVSGRPEIGVPVETPEPTPEPQPVRAPRPAPGPGAFMWPTASGGTVEFAWREAATTEEQGYELTRLVRYHGVTQLRVFEAILAELVDLYRDGRLTPEIVAANWDGLISPALERTIQSLAKGASAGSMTRFRDRVQLTAGSLGAISHT
ncbi:MAG: hypothetical protein ACRDPW_03190, partial [Mycobacteriales bacterium]